MLTSTEKVRLHRLRQKRGRLVVTDVEIGQDFLDLLIRDQFLGEWDACDKQKIRSALEQFLEVRSAYR